MVVVFPFNDPHPPRSSRSPSEPSHTVSRSGSKLEVTLPGVSRDNTKVEVVGNKVIVTGKKGGHVVYKLERRMSGADNGVDIRKENGSVTVKVQRRQ